MMITNILNGLFHGCLVHFANIANYTSLFATELKVSVKENEVPTEKNSSRASIFAAKASYISN